MLKSELCLLLACLQVDSPMNLKHPHDLVILMRQETTVNYLKELEVRQWKCDMHLKLVESVLFLKPSSSPFHIYF